MVAHEYRRLASGTQRAADRVSPANGFPTEAFVDKVLTEKMRHRSDPPYQPQRIETVEDNLRAFLSKRIDEPFAINSIQSLAGGSSKEQFAFELQRVGAAGQVICERLVLRLEPPEGPVQTHRLREFQALEALYGALPVPRPYWVDADGSELSRPGLIYEFCAGRQSPAVRHADVGRTAGIRRTLHASAGPPVRRPAR